jgi:ATP-dependent Clp protease ATP-binding subunit ClpA
MFDDVIRPTGPVLARYTRDLTAEARAGRLEPVRAREPEIGRVLDILLRQGKNNPALVGPAGVGKTAIVEGLAQRVARGDVPLALRDARILSLDHVSLLAGTTYRGQYEERIQGLVAESTAAPNVVLFIDELHNLIGQGTAMGVPMDAANMLKPALVRGDFRVIGATTDDEYDRWVCSDPALERRFQKVAVRELSAAETMDVLRSRMLGLERHHNVVITDDALNAAVELTDIHITDRMRPDRALDALDEACAHAHGAASYSPDTERLVLERRALLKRELRQRDARPDDQEAPRAGGAGRMDDRAAPNGEGGEPDEVGRLARESIAALERFGADIEALLGFPPSARPADAASGGDAPDGAAAAARTARAASPAPRASLSHLDVEIRRRLADEGVVVRGYDVARVVALACNCTVRWPAS